MKKMPVTEFIAILRKKLNTVTGVTGKFLVKV